ncbi:PQQ-dependent sugar dehydrogenase [Microlunatus phosphovorus]|uniref:PQQ-dependent sugar dehydrogenase n=1 Tax=Microlunatus phosphovorus TaxID=29405 RepID=UPI0018D2DD3B|nr:PQQ-dependent sugar dehydrogenase [Microlunatus phosphovorus]
MLTDEPGKFRVVATGLGVPWDLAMLPGGDALVTLRDRAEVVLIAPGEVPTVVARIDDARPEGEGGLMGIALSPDFVDDQFVYLYFTADQDNRVVRYKYANGSLTSAEPILSGIPRASNHNGGRIRFGPDQMLYVTTGDNHAKPAYNAQNTQTLDGKILRVTPSGKAPEDNPFENEVWSYGHRNVQGIGWDAKGRMYASEFGSGEFDELNLIKKGGNYGWPEAEGRSDNPDFIEPLLTWSTDDASPSGIAVMPNGTVFLASLRGERLWRARWDGDRMTDDVYFDGVGRLRAVEVVGDELWLLTNNTSGGDPAKDDDRLIAIGAS